MIDEMTELTSYIKIAVDYAKESFRNGGFPNGALILRDGDIVGEGIFKAPGVPDPTAHMEVTAIRNACAALETADLSGATLVSSLEPCMMCFYSAYWAGIDTILYACSKEGIDVPNGYASTMNVAEAASRLHRPVKAELISGFEEVMMELLMRWKNR